MMNVLRSDNAPEAMPCAICLCEDESFHAAASEAGGSVIAFAFMNGFFSGQGVFHAEEVLSRDEIWKTVFCQRHVEMMKLVKEAANNIVQTALEAAGLAPPKAG